VLGDELAHALWAQVSGLRHARHLQRGVHRADVGVEAAARARDGVRREHGVGAEAVLFAVGFGQIREAEVGLVGVLRGRIVVDAVDELVAGRAEVRAARVGRVVSGPRRRGAGGVLYFSSNFSRFRLDPARLESFDVTEITRETIPRDFERNARIHVCYAIRARASAT
jgi:hypothetical protein